MFRKNSAFTPTEKEVEYVEGIRKRALDADPFPARNTRESNADILLEAAESMLDDEDNRQALLLISEAREELRPRPDSRA